MDSQEHTIADFQAKVRVLLARYKQLKRENGELADEISRCKSDIDRLNGELSSKTDDYEKLKMAKMISISDNDLDGAKERLSKLIRDVNKCISILTQTN